MATKKLNLDELKLGDTISIKEYDHRAIRLVKSSSLFDPDDGSPPYILTELYWQTKTPKGEINFILVSEEKTIYEGPSSAIKGLSPGTSMQREWKPKDLEDNDAHINTIG